MIFTVKTKYEDYEFDNKNEAMDFAIAAMMHSKETDKCDIEVRREENDTND